MTRIPRRGVVGWLAFAAGALALAWLVSVVPDETFRATQTLLLVAAALVLLLVASGVFLVPARRLLARVFILPLKVPAEGVFGMAREDEVRVVLRPLVVAAVLFGVATLAALLR